MHTESDKSALFDTGVAACRAHGLRITEPRKALLRAILECVGPFSAADLARHREVRGRCDLATVYRTLWALEKTGVVRRVAVARSEGHYALDLPGQHVDYLVCDSCGTTSGVPDGPALKKLEEDVARLTGFQVTHHDIQFHGICPSCREIPSGQGKPREGSCQG